MGIEVELAGQNAWQDDLAVRMVATGRGTLERILGDKATRFRLFSNGLNWDRVFLARLDGQVVGFLAFQWAGHGPYSPKFRDFVVEFGLVSAVWRWLLFQLLEFRTRHRGFYIYGFKVLRQARRKGVASALLQAAEAHASNLGTSIIVLDVVASNQRAWQFYTQRGFTEGKVSRLGPFARLLGLPSVMSLRKIL
jgi:ribosomal protein S18 acetylase RimI-like enzyme